jgi:hypothetical protein
MRRIKTFRIFESEGRLSPEAREFLDTCCVPYPDGPHFNQPRDWGRLWSINPKTGLVDVDGSVNFERTEPRWINEVHPREKITLKDIDFGRVEGNFDCSNMRIGSLEGAPREVGGSFRAIRCQLESLVGGPKVVGGFYSCEDNKFKNLIGAPERVGEGIYGGGFYCSYNPLESLEGAPKFVEGEFVFMGSHKVKIEVPIGEWGPEKVIELYIEGNENQKRFVLPLFGSVVTTEDIQKLVDERPEKTLVGLKGILDLPVFKGVRWPKGLEREAELLSDLDDIGL